MLIGVLHIRAIFYDVGGNVGIIVRFEMRSESVRDSMRGMADCGGTVCWCCFAAEQYSV